MKRLLNKSIIFGIMSFLTGLLLSLVFFSNQIKMYILDFGVKIIINNKIYGKQGVVFDNPQKTYKGYTLLSTFDTDASKQDRNFEGSILIDMQGNIIKKWRLSVLSTLFPDGSVLGLRLPRWDSSGLMEMREVVQLDWQGSEVWNWRGGGKDLLGEAIAKAHNDLQREGRSVGYFVPGQNPKTRQGNTLILAHENLSKPNISPVLLEDDIIYEVDWNGAIKWKWTAAEHVDEFGFSDEMRKAIRKTKIYPPRIAGGGAVNITSWLHLNSASYLGSNRWYDAGDQRFNPNNIIVNSREANLILIIEKSSGKVVWKVGPEFSGQSPDYKLQQIIGPHHAHMVPSSLPGGGNIIVFDNGGTAGYGDVFLFNGWPNHFRIYSRIIEFDPITKKVVWEYKREIPFEGERYKFFSWYIGSVQRLENGNTLICEGISGRIFEITPQSEIVWEYISSLANDSMRRSSFFGGSVYRAYRYPLNYLEVENPRI